MSQVRGECRFTFVTYRVIRAFHKCNVWFKFEEEKKKVFIHSCAIDVRIVRRQLLCVTVEMKPNKRKLIFYKPHTIISSTLYVFWIVSYPLFVLNLTISLNCLKCAGLGLIDRFVHAPVLKPLRQSSPLPRFHRFHNCHQHNDTVAVATVFLCVSFSLSHAHIHTLDLRGLPPTLPAALISQVSPQFL